VLSVLGVIRNRFDLKKVFGHHKVPRLFLTIGASKTALNRSFASRSGFSVTRDFADALQQVVSTSQKTGITNGLLQTA
jgi:hypothetical protein